MTLPRGPIGSGTQNQNTRTSLVVPDNTGSLVFPTAKEVENFHRNSDADKRPEAIHHSLGNAHNKAAYGDHVHDGSTSQALVATLAGTFGQNLGTPQGQKDAIKQLIQLLVPVGATDTTTAVGTYPEIRMGTTSITWTAAGVLSDAIAVTFSPTFSAAPTVALGMLSSDAAIMFSARVTAPPTTTTLNLRVLASVSIAAGGARNLMWLAINMKAYT